MTRTWHDTHEKTSGQRRGSNNAAGVPRAQGRQYSQLPLDRLVEAVQARPRACWTQHRNDPISLRLIESPVGPLLAGASRDGLCLLAFADAGRTSLEKQCIDIAGVWSRSITDDRLAAYPGREHLDTAQEELRAYFAGELQDFNVSLNIPGTVFERKVWTTLQRIPFGERTSYSRLAFKIGSPGAARAVGRANSRNRIAIIVPCHRVVNEDGSLGGYAGGITRKQHLLDIESRSCESSSLFTLPLEDETSVCSSAGTNRRSSSVERV